MPETTTDEMMPPPVTWPTTEPYAGSEPVQDETPTETVEVAEEAVQTPPKSRRKPRIGVTSTRDLVNRTKQMKTRVEGFLSALDKLGIEPDMEGLSGIRHQLMKAATDADEALRLIEELTVTVMAVSETVENL